MAKAPFRAATYCRISRDDEGEGQGVERQRADCLKLVERNDWAIVSDGENDTFTDNDISGAKDDTERPALGRLVAAIRAGKVDAVVAYTQARIYRDTAKFLGFCDLLKQCNVETLALVSDANINPAGSLFVATIIAAKDAEERRRTGELVAREKRTRAERGEFAGGRRPYGYQIEDKKLVVDEAEAAVIRMMADRILEGTPLMALARDLNENGIKPARAEAWTAQAIRDLLLRPSVAGFREHQGEIIGKANWIGILPEDQWRQVGDILRNPARATPRRSRSYPLKGLLICGECSRELKSRADHGERFYSCTKKSGGCGHVWIKAERLERYVFDLILPLLDSPDLTDAATAHEGAINDEAATLMAANAKDQAKLRELGDMLSDDEIDHASYVHQAKRLNERINSRTTQIASLRGHSALDRIGCEVQAQWQEMSPEDRSLILSTVLEDITIKKFTLPKGSNRFDRDRIGFRFVKWSIPALLARIKLTEADYPRPSPDSEQMSDPYNWIVGDEGFWLEDLREVADLRR